MKTLKQILDEQIPPIGHLQCDDEDVIESVKEWLQQQQQKYKNTILISIDELFTELLEELNQ